jgi:spore maturation protein CgeB
MKLVIFGLTISSSWGNGHATLWRGFCKALARKGHRVVFFERDVPFYASNRDLVALPHGRLVLYHDWASTYREAARELADADAAIVTSYCPDAIAAGELIAASPRALSVFYDLDTPVTLSRLESGDPVSYIGPRGLSDFDLVLSFTGGAALDRLQHRLGARLVAPLYGHVDPEVHRPAPPVPHYRADLSYLGTYSADRQDALQSLFIEPARRRAAQRFVLGGAQYPQHFPWYDNMFFVRHLPPDEHPAFFSSSRLTLNVTRAPMAELGWCPSGRLFEAAACGTPVITDRWSGIETFFASGTEILIADATDDVLAALDLDDAEVRRIAAAARERVLAEHTSERRADELIDALQMARAPLAAAVGA